MWVITTEGFYSAVEHRDDANLIMVRARVKADLDRLKRRTGLGFKIKRTAVADYPYRATMSRADWAEACAILAADVDYDNFKDAVKERRGWERANVYMRVWSALHSIQSVRQRWPKLPRRRSWGSVPRRLTSARRREGTSRTPGSRSPRRGRG
jgi:hypothetical protein